MNKELKKIGELYSRICEYCSKEENSLLSIGKLRKEYGISKRDLRILFQFWYTYFFFFDDCVFDFQMTDSDGKYIELEDSIEQLKDVDREVDVLLEKMNDNWNLKIYDSIKVLKEKIRLQDFTVGNASMPSHYKQKIKQSLVNLGDVLVDELYVVDKNEITGKIQGHKSLWVRSILNNKCIDMDFTGANRKIYKKEVHPIGMYYDKFLQKYYGVYIDDNGSCLEVDISDILSLKETEKTFYPIDFDIDEYRQQKQQCKMVLKVYDEGNVKCKLSKLLSDNQLHQQEFENFSRYTFYTEDEWLYADIIKQYGRSVVIEEPVYIKEEMMKDIQVTLESYGYED